jgi:malate synthase
VTATDLARMNTAPPGFNLVRDLPQGFAAFYEQLHSAFAPRQKALARARIERLARAHRNGELPDHLPPSPATTGDWRIEVPAWCQDQRNQMTGPADDAELVVKMLNSGAPGVMLDLEDSMANTWPNLMRGIDNILDALVGRLSYNDKKRARTVGIQPSPTVIWSRVRGLHLSQRGVMPDGTLTSASLFDLALIVHRVEIERLRHPLCFYIPKSESADEALWWRDVLQALARSRDWPANAIKCMALVESHPLAYQMEEFLFHLRDHIVGLNLGRWDYMASLSHFAFEDPNWVLPDRNTIPHDVPFFQRLRYLMVNVCHSRGALAIGGMTALFPSREDAELNARALDVLQKDKRNEADCGMDGAWTGHPDQNAIAVAQFPAVNQLGRLHDGLERYPDLRPVPTGVGLRTVAGTNSAVRTVIRYRRGVLEGRGASLLDGYMEDLATDRIYRLMISQRMRHRADVAILGEDGKSAPHDPEFVTASFDRQMEALIALEDAKNIRIAREQSENMIRRRSFNPV